MIPAREMKFKNYWVVESCYILSTATKRLSVSGIAGYFWLFLNLILWLIWLGQNINTKSLGNPWT